MSNPNVIRRTSYCYTLLYTIVSGTQITSRISMTKSDKSVHVEDELRVEVLKLIESNS